MKLAQRVDPNGERTIGVLTRIDRVEDGGLACRDALNNNVTPRLRHGNFAVRNRTLAELESSTDVPEGLEKERDFFDSHRILSSDPSLLARCGVKKLAKALNTIYMQKIRDSTPTLRDHVASKISSLEQELQVLGGVSESDQGREIHKIIQNFVKTFQAILAGRQASHQDRRYPVDQITGGGKIDHAVFKGIFEVNMKQVDPFRNLSDAQIQAAMINNGGLQRSEIMEDGALHELFRVRGNEFKEIGADCVNLVAEELRQIAEQSYPKQLERFPHLRDRMYNVVMTFIDNTCVPFTLERIVTAVEVEKARFNVRHPRYIKAPVAAYEVSSPEDDISERTSPTHTTTMEPISPMTTRTSSMADDDASATDALSTTPANASKKKTKKKRGIFGKSSTQRDATPTRLHTPSLTSFPTPTSSHEPVIGRRVPINMRAVDVPSTGKDDWELETIRKCLQSYFDIIREKFTDTVPKEITLFLIHKVRDEIHGVLFNHLHKEALFDTLLQEADDVERRRIECRNKLRHFQEALHLLDEIRNYPLAPATSAHF